MRAKDVMPINGMHLRKLRRLYEACETFRNGETTGPGAAHQDLKNILGLAEHSLSYP